MSVTSIRNPSATKSVSIVLGKFDGKWFSCVEQDGMYWTADNGLTWNKIDFGSSGVDNSSTYVTICYSGTTWVASDQSGHLVKSTDLSTWTSVSVPSGYPSWAYSTRFMNGLFVNGVKNDGGTIKFATSADGTTWSTVSSNLPASGSGFVECVSGWWFTKTDSGIYRSSDLVTWSITTNTITSYPALIGSSSVLFQTDWANNFRKWNTATNQWDAIAASDTTYVWAAGILNGTAALVDLGGNYRLFEGAVWVEYPKLGGSYYNNSNDPYIQTAGFSGTEALLFGIYGDAAYPAPPADSLLLTYDADTQGDMLGYARTKYGIMQGEQFVMSGILATHYGTIADKSDTNSLIVSGPTATRHGSISCQYDQTGSIADSFQTKYGIPNNFQVVSGGATISQMTGALSVKHGTMDGASTQTGSMSGQVQTHYGTLQSEASYAMAAGAVVTHYGALSSSVVGQMAGQAQTRYGLPISMTPHDLATAGVVTRYGTLTATSSMQSQMTGTMQTRYGTIDTSSVFKILPSMNTRYGTMKLNRGVAC